MVRGA